jgi:type VII secretion protein EccB
MASRQNQLHSYQFTVQRAVSALVIREPDPAQAPFRGVVGATFASVMIAVLALAAVGIYGLIVSGGNTSWRQQNAVVLEKESGTKYVYIDGKLHPTLNIASALLIGGASDPDVRSVSRRSLLATPRGPRLGIPGAPDSLPERKNLRGVPWTVCSSVVRQANGTLAPQSVLLVGEAPAGGGTVGQQYGMLVRSTDEYLIWNGHKYRIPDADRQIVGDALGIGTAAVTEAAPAWLNSLPSGVDLARIQVPGNGASAVRGYRVGDVAVVDTPGSGRRNYLAVADGLAPITQLQANLLIFNKSVQKQESPDWFAAQPRSSVTLPGSTGTTALPEQPPTLVGSPDERRSTCAVFRDASGVPEIIADAQPPSTSNAVVTGSRSTTETVLSDRVLVAPGRGAVVEALTSPDATSGTFVLITDLGMAFPVVDRRALDSLGYRTARVTRLPAGLVALLPQGRALDPVAARAPAVTG